MRELKEFSAAYKAEGGLVPNAACHTIFGVSRQRWQKMSTDYMFKSYEICGKKWFSKNQLQQFHKLDRSEYGGRGKGVDMAQMARDCLKDASTM